MANNPYVNKVQTADGNTIMDISGDTVTPSDVLNGVTFHSRSGAAQQGSLITHDVYDGLDSSSTSDALSANQGRVLNSNIENMNVPIIADGTITTTNGSGQVLVNNQQITISKFINAFVVDATHDRRILIHTYNSVVFGFVTNAQGNAVPDGTHNLKVIKFK